MRETVERFNASTLVDLETRVIPAIHFGLIVPGVCSAPVFLLTTMYIIDLTYTSSESCIT